MVKKAAEEYVSHLKSGKSKDEAMERCSQSRFIAAKLHTIGYIFGMYREAVEEMEEGQETAVLKKVCALYGLWQVEEQQGYFLKCEWLYDCWIVCGAERSHRRLLYAAADGQGAGRSGRSLCRDPRGRR